MSKAPVACPGCGQMGTRKNGRDRRGRQIYQCRSGRRRCTTLTGTPFAGYRFPPDVSALAVRWYVRFRLRYADVAELLAERGVDVDASTIDDWVYESAPLYEDAARSFHPALEALDQALLLESWRFVVLCHRSPSRWLCRAVWIAGEA